MIYHQEQCLINEFIESLNLCENTAKTYTSRLRYFVKWIGRRGGALNRLSMDDIADYYFFWRHRDGIDSLTASAYGKIA